MFELHSEHLYIGTFGLILVSSYFMLMLCIKGLQAKNALNRNLDELKHLTQRYQRRYAQLQKFAANRFLSMNRLSFERMQLAGEIISQAENLLTLSEECQRNKDFELLEKLLNFQFRPGEAIGRRFDGTVITLPRSAFWPKQIDSLLETIHDELSGSEIKSIISSSREASM